MVYSLLTPTDTFHYAFHHAIMFAGNLIKIDIRISYALPFVDENYQCNNVMFVVNKVIFVSYDSLSFQCLDRSFHLHYDIAYQPSRLSAVFTEELWHDAGYLRTTLFMLNSCMYLNWVQCDYVTSKNRKCNCTPTTITKYVIPITMLSNSVVLVPNKSSGLCDVCMRQWGVSSLVYGLSVIELSYRKKLQRNRNESDGHENALKIASAKS